MQSDNWTDLPEINADGFYPVMLSHHINNQASISIINISYRRIFVAPYSEKGKYF